MQGSRPRRSERSSPITCRPTPLTCHPERSRIAVFRQFCAVEGPCVFSRNAAGFPAASVKQSENGHAVGGSHEYISVGDSWRDEFITGAELVAAAGRLIAVVEFLQGRGIIGVEH